MFWAKMFIVILQTAMYGWLWFHHYKDMMPVVYWNRGNWTIIALYGLFIVVFSRAFGALKVGYLKTWDIMYSQLLTILCVNAVAYLQLALINGDWKFLENSGPIFALAGLDLIIVLIWALFMRWIYAFIYPPHEMLLIYGDVSPDTIIRKIESRKDKYHVKEKIPLSAGMERIFSEILKYDAVLIGDIPVGDRNTLIQYCFEENIRCYGSPQITDIMIRHSESIDLFDSPLLLFRNNGLTYRQMFVKRIMDIAFSLVGVVLASPVMLLIAFFVKIYDGGPVFYRQKRQTKDGREFEQEIHAQEIDPHNCSYNELMVLNLETGHTSPADYLHAVAARDKAGIQSFFQDKDFAACIRAVMSDHRQMGSWDSYLSYDKWLQKILDYARGK